VTGAPDEQLVPGSTPVGREDQHDETAERVSLARPLVGGAARGSGHHEQDEQRDERKARRWSDWLDGVL
jgi:hypothetical protein